VTLPASSSPPERSNGEIVQATLAFVGVALAFGLIYRFYMIVVLLFLGLVLGTAIRPVVEWLYRQGLTRAGGVFFIYLGILTLALGIFWLILPPLIGEAVAAAEGIPTYYQSLRDFLLQSAPPFLQNLGTRLPETLDLTALTEQLKNLVPTLSQVGQALGYTGLILRTLIAILTVFLLAFYWTLESDWIIESFLMLLPIDRRDGFHKLITSIETKLGAYTRGQILLMASVGLMSMIAYMIIGLPYPLVLGVLAGIFEVVPVIGPTLGALPAVALGLSQSPEKILWVIGASVLIQFSENNLLVPRIMGRALGVSPVVTLLALATFTSFLGLTGAILAVPAAAIIQVLLDYFILTPATNTPAPPERRDSLGRLHYETQELVQDIRKQLLKKETPHSNEKASPQQDSLELLAEELEQLLTDLETREKDQKP